MNTSLKHIALIPDGNRRWAKQHGLPVILGHQKGYEKVRDFISFSKSVGIQYVTVWAFSTENWNRKEEEVDDLMKLILNGLAKIHDDARKEKSKVVHIGRKDRLSKEIISLMNIIENETKTYQDFCLVLAVDYGGNDELQRAGQELVLASNTSKRIGDYLDTAKVLIPDVDLVVRTGGEKRTSGFLPVQSAYAEWIFDHRLLPDFDKNAFDEVIKEYHTRSRRYGM